MVTYEHRARTQVRNTHTVLRILMSICTPCAYAAGNPNQTILWYTWSLPCNIHYNHILFIITVTCVSTCTQLSDKVVSSCIFFYCYEIVHTGNLDIKSNVGWFEDSQSRRLQIIVSKISLIWLFYIIHIRHTHTKYIHTYISCVRTSWVTIKCGALQGFNW